MKKIFLPVLMGLLLSACQENEPKSTADKATLNSPEEEAVGKPPRAYVGVFEAEKVNEQAQSPTFTNKINISITSLQDGKVEGFSIIAGTRQLFDGTYSLKGNQFEVNAREPGTDKHDGRFEFTLDTLAKKLNGYWYCFDTTVDVPVRKYALEERVFSYDPSAKLPAELVGTPFYDARFEEVSGGEMEAITKDVLKFNPSVQELKKSDVENLFKGDLEVLRNSIYARHGYSFRNRKMRFLFDNYPEWYMPFSVNVEKELTELEKKNIDLLKRFEDHAEKYYDEFGR